ncbi:sigma-54 dependent transcriptional regulator [Desulfobaculum senezii]
MARVLVVDDDPFVRDYMKNALTRQGHDITAAASCERARAASTAQAFDIVILDVRLPDGDGLAMLPALRGRHGGPEVIVLTGANDPDVAERAMRGGAWDFIVKPCSLDRMTHSLRRALQYRGQRDSGSAPRLHGCDIVGSSPALRECLEQAARAAQTRADVLITGETGTGKDLIARCIHRSSAQASRPFVVVDCAALPQGLAESLLFGHVRGAFTGADMTRAGLIKQAHGGTLFLDEVGELPLDVQSTFLRVLQERRFRPVGASHEEESDFRLIAATNRDLDVMTATGAFRDDVLFRLKSLVLRLPPLRHRREDIASLAVYLLARLAHEAGEPVKGASPEFLGVLAASDWPGNVRELRQVLGAAALAAGSEPTLYPHHLPVEFKVRYARCAVGDTAQAEQSAPCGGDAVEVFPGQPWKEYRRMVMEDAERRYIRSLMAFVEGDAKRAMALSGLKSARFYQLLRQYWRREGL